MQPVVTPLIFDFFLPTGPEPAPNSHISSDNIIGGSTKSRRTSRTKRERPDYYSASEYETQIRRVSQRHQPSLLQWSKTCSKIVTFPVKTSLVVLHLKSRRTSRTKCEQPDYYSASQCEIQIRRVTQRCQSFLIAEGRNPLAVVQNLLKNSHISSDNIVGGSTKSLRRTSRTKHERPDYCSASEYETQIRRVSCEQISLIGAWEKKERKGKKDFYRCKCPHDMMPLHLLCFTFKQLTFKAYLSCDQEL